MYDKAIQIYPNRSEVYLYKGLEFILFLALQSLGRFEDAISM